MGKVFISYAREDRKTAEKIYNDLKKDNVDVWFDSVDLLPGQDWDYAIKEVIRNCSYFLAILSSNSISKKGYIQKELRIALDVLDELPPDSIFFIPIRISECTPKYEKIRKLNFVDLFIDYEDGMERIKRVVSPNKVIDSTVGHYADMFFKAINSVSTNLSNSNKVLAEQFEHFNDFANKILFNLVETYANYQKFKEFPNEEISASVKLIIDGKEIANLYGNLAKKIRGKFLITVARDPNTYLTSEREVLSTLYSIDGNTIYDTLLNKRIEYFYCNNLKALSQSSKYLNEDLQWSNYYNAASAVSIRSLIEGKFVYLGALTVYSMNKNNIELFGNSEAKFILEQSAALISIYFNNMTLLNVQE